MAPSPCLALDLAASPDTGVAHQVITTGNTTRSDTLTTTGASEEEAEVEEVEGLAVAGEEEEEEEVVEVEGMEGSLEWITLGRRHRVKMQLLRRLKPCWPRCGWRTRR